MYSRLLSQCHDYTNIDMDLYPQCAVDNISKIAYLSSISQKVQFMGPELSNKKRDIISRRVLPTYFL